METVKMDHFKQFVDHNIPLVFVDRVPVDFNTYCVMIDNYHAAFMATSHLIEQGCKRIAHYCGAQHRYIYSERKRGYIDALKKYGLEIDEELIRYSSSLSYEEGEAITKELLKMKNPPDGIFSTNDTAAVAAIKCAIDMGVSIPEELAVIGFNDDPLASIISPGLSSVTHPAIKMGEASAQIVINHINNKQLVKTDRKEKTFLNTKIVVRESSKKLILSE
jgi:LacI family transcriptional regulator